MTELVMDRAMALKDLGQRLKDAPLGDVKLTPEEQRLTVFSKYVSPDPLVADFIPGDPWRKTTITNEGLGIEEDDGIILRFEGRSRGEVGVTPAGEVLSMDEVAMREEATGRNIPRYLGFVFRLDSAEKTDGPAQRQELQRSAENRRAEGEANLMDTIGKAFQQAMSNGGSPEAAGMPADMLQQALAEMSPAQRRAQLEMAESIAEDAPKKGK